MPSNSSSPRSSSLEAADRLRRLHDVLAAGAAIARPSAHAIAPTVSLSKHIAALVKGGKFSEAITAMQDKGLLQRR